MESLKPFNPMWFPALWTISLRSLSDLSRREESLVWLDLLKMSEERERLKSLEEDRLSRFLEKERMFFTRSS